MSEHGVGIKAHFGIQRDHLAIFGQHKRIDFHHVTIIFDKDFAESLHESTSRANRFAFDAQSFTKFANLKSLKPVSWIERLFEDLFRRLFSDLFNLNATFTRSHQDWHRSGPIEHDTQIQFPINVTTRFDVNLVDRFALVTGLNGDQSVTKHVLGRFSCRFGTFDNLDAMLFRDLFKSTLSATASMNLRLHSTNGCSHFGKCRCCFLGRGCDFSTKDCHTLGAKYFFALEFVNFHDYPIIR